MSVSRLTALCILLLILTIFGSLQAQVIRIEDEREQDTLIIPFPFPSSSQFEGLDQVDRLMRFGEFQRAADLMELIVEKNPDNIHLKNLLTDCYEQAKNYDKLILFLKERMASEPPHYQLLRSFGRAYVLTGSPDSALPLFLAALRNNTTNQVRGIASLAGIYHQFGHYRLESEFLDSARAFTGDPTLLADRMGDALAAQKEFGAATLEYLTYMEKDTMAVRNTTQKLEAMMTFPESADTVMAILSERIKTQANNRHLLNTYGQLLMRQDRYDEAFSFFKGLDSLEAGIGGSVLYFMQECNVRGHFDYTLQAGEYMLAHRAESTLKNSVLFAMAEAWTAIGQYDRALTAYQSVTRDQIRPAHRAEANLKIGLLYKDYIGDFSQAAEYLYEITRSVPRGHYDVKARIALADLAIRQNLLDSAIALYQSLDDLDLSEDVLEQIEYSQAEIYLFKEEYNEALISFRQIISRYPRGFFINDAIQYSLILSETLEEARSQIDLFSSAEYYRYIGRSDSLEYYLTKICRVGIRSLAPISYLRLGQLYHEQERHDEAINTADSLVSLYPQSYFYPYGLKLKADIYLTSLQKPQEAFEIYRSLLENYPTYPFASEIRDIIRREMPADRI